MRPNRLRQTWAEGGHVVCGWLSIPNSYTAEVMARMGFDALCIDMQHGLIDYGDIVPMLQAISQTETVPIARVPWNDPAIMMKVLDAGAYGVIVPLINNRAEAERAVQACRYPPMGFRSYGPIRASAYGGADYAEHANEEILVLAMIETADGLANLDEICSTPGLSGVYIGPSDLGYALGLAPKMDSEVPVHVEAVARILAACKRHNIICGIHTGGVAFSKRFIEQGMHLVTLTSDAGSLALGARQQLAQVRADTGAGAARGTY
ncbi:MAG: aldolase/citrate lyase family protein [Dehalococcoidia bacterium]